MNRDQFSEIVNQCLGGITTTQIERLIKDDIMRKIYPLIKESENLRIELSKEISTRKTLEEKNKHLEHHKDWTCGLWATDKEPDDKNHYFRIDY